MNRVNAVKIVGTVTPHKSIFGSVAPAAEIAGKIGINVPWVKDYERLRNKPQINEVELLGNRTANQLKLQESMDSLTNMELEEILEL